MGSSPCGLHKTQHGCLLVRRGIGGGQVVARDHHGSVLFAASRRVRGQWPVEISEGKALYFALRLAHAHELKDIIIEFDCQLLINCLSKGAIFFSDLDSILEDALMLSKNFHAVSRSHVLRDGNWFAHHLDRVIPFGVEQRWENHCPPEVSSYILMDTLSFS